MFWLLSVILHIFLSRSLWIWLRWFLELEDDQQGLWLKAISHPNIDVVRIHRPDSDWDDIIVYVTKGKAVSNVQVSCKWQSCQNVLIVKVLCVCQVEDVYGASMLGCLLLQIWWIAVQHQLIGSGAFELQVIAVALLWWSALSGFCASLWNLLPSEDSSSLSGNYSLRPPEFMRPHFILRISAVQLMLQLLDHLEKSSRNPGGRRKRQNEKKRAETIHWGQRERQNTIQSSEDELKRAAGSVTN